MSEVVHLSTGYEVEFRFDSSKWKEDLRHLAHAIIGERLQQHLGPDEPADGTPSSPLEEGFLEEIRYIVATANDVFKHSLIAAVILDAVDRAYRSAVRAAEAEETPREAGKKRRGRRGTRKAS